MAVEFSTPFMSIPSRPRLAYLVVVVCSTTTHNGTISVVCTMYYLSSLRDKGEFAEHKQLTQGVPREALPINYKRGQSVVPDAKYGPSRRVFGQQT